MTALHHLATGGSQHVLVRETADPRWVYKIPAVFRTLHRVPQDVRLLQPRGRLKRAARAILIRVGEPWTGVAVGLYMRHSRRRQFGGMLRVLEEARRREIADVMLPCRGMRRARIRVRLPARVASYTGPLLVQRRVDHFFHRRGGLGLFEWEALIHLEHRLWRHGFALTDADTALGPHNWALLRGRLHLADTASLTTDPRRARRVLAPDVLDSLQERQLRQARRHALEEPFDAYYRRVRREISRERFDTLWCADV